MTQNPVWCLPEDAVSEVARVMRREHTASIPVVTDEQRRELIGILCDRDLAIKVLGESRDPNRTTVYEVMTRTVVACRNDDDLSSASLAMDEHEIRRIPIVDYSGRLVGIIARSDLFIPAPRRRSMVPDLRAA